MRTYCQGESLTPTLGLIVQTLEQLTRLEDISLRYDF
jgi:hypothetical protein